MILKFPWESVNVSERKALVPQKIRTGTLAGAGVPSLSITFPEIKMGIAFTAELFVVLLAG